MTQTLLRETLPVGSNPEHSPDAVYAQVMEQAQLLNPFNDELSARRAALYQTVGVVPVALGRLPIVSYGHRLLVSDQTVQPGGSYKIRGGAHALIVGLERDPDITDVSICSAGNAARGLQLACLALGPVRGKELRLIVECTLGASAAKVAPLKADGALVNQMHTEFEHGQLAVRRRGEQRGHLAIEAYDQIETIAGQATIGWETLSDLMGQAQQGEIDLHNTPINLFVPVGGGGLIAGIACVMRWAKDQGVVGENVQVYGVQMEGCDAMKRYVDPLRAGLTLPEDLFAEGLPFNPAADGTAVRRPGVLTRAIVADDRFVADMVSVTPAELGIAMTDLTKCHGRQIEPAGALSLAGARAYMQAFPARPRVAPSQTIVTFTTGANVTDELYGQFATWGHGLRQAKEWQAAAEVEAYRANLRALGQTAMELDWRTQPRQRSVAGVVPIRQGSRVGHSPARAS